MRTWSTRTARRSPAGGERMPVNRRQTLAAAGALQLACGAAGLALALRRHRSYAFLFLRGRPETVARDAAVLGTALSAPGPMLAAQAWAVTTLARRDSLAAEKTLGLLGAAMVVGYLGEELVRQRLTRGGFDAVETPVAAAGLGLAAVLAAGGLPSLRRPPSSASSSSVVA